MNADPEWFSTTDAAKQLGMTQRAVYRFIDTGQLPAYRFGRVIRVRSADLNEFIERARITPER